MIKTIYIRRPAALIAALAVQATFALICEAWAQENHPERCSDEQDVQSIALTTWESGLGAWTPGTHDVVNPATFDTPDWSVVSNLPDDRTGMAAFVPNLLAGDCDEDDETGVLSLDSPPIEIPANADRPLLSFHHWFDTEFGWDGGNVKISVNGGPFDLLPTSAFELAPYNETLFPAEDELGEFSSNPLAGEPAFTGTPDFQGTGEWIESRVDLSGFAAPGDTVRLRFDFGIDACDGEEGWYVDEVEIYSCGAEPPPSDTSLTLAKQVVNDDGGTAVASDWTLSANGPTSFEGPGPMVNSPPDFAPGVYTLTESGGPPGYAGSAWSCEGGNQNDADTITLDAGDIATCSITNDDMPDPPSPDFQINAGLNDAWFDPVTGGQGFFITVFPEIELIFLAWFTYEIDRPHGDVMAMLGDPGHRWLTAFGGFDGDRSVLDIEITEGGVFDSPEPDPEQSVEGTIILEFTGCNAGTVTYDIPSVGLQGVVPIQRIALDNVAYCESFLAQP